MRILGIDPGLLATGFGVVERTGDQIFHIAHGTIRPARGLELAQRLGVIASEIERVIEQHAPERAVIEKVFVSASAKSALVLGQARGSALLALAESELEISEYSALEIKRAITGTGRANKEQVQHMVRVLLGMDRKPPQDAADALACAICHLHYAEVQQRQTVARSADQIEKSKGL